MSKKIVLFSDGTGNSSAKAQKTNVWRMFQALDQTKADQIAKYDDGVGTSPNKYLAAIGGAFGWGLKRNVLDLYRFVCRNYEKGDDIYGFGFSRGSFTIRVLVDFIATEGLVSFRSEEELSRNAAAAYRHYRSKKFPSDSPLVFLMRRLRDAVLWLKDRVRGYRTYGEAAAQTRAEGRAEIPIRFLGLWDTVEAYGVPIVELKRGIDRMLWPMVFGDLILSPRVQRACHALSLDDERTTFHPLLWDEVSEAAMVAKGQVPPGRITQVWFAGVHSNIGGGYPEDQLSFVTLDWMMGEAIANDLVLDERAVAEVRAAESPYARRYDSRAGLASYYRYSPREIQVKQDQKGNDILPIIHGSVVMRMAYGSDRYAPISLPHEFWVLAPDGELLAMEGVARSLQIDMTKRRMASARPATKSDATIAATKTRLIGAIAQLSRPGREEVRLVWDTVFWRRLNYFVTFTLTALLVAYPLVGDLIAKFEHWYLTTHPLGHVGAITESGLKRIDVGARGPIASVVDALSGFVPSYASPWISALEKYPIEFAATAALVVLSLLGSRILDARIRDRTWFGWHKTFRPGYLERSKEARNGLRIGVLVALAIAAISVALANTYGLSAPIRRDLWVVVGVLVAYLVLHNFIERPVLRSEEGALAGSRGLSLARLLRNNRFLRAIYGWIFDGAVPIVFALLLVVAGFVVANRALFDVVSASGFFCAGKANQDALERDTDTFPTASMCWPSGWVLQKGERYRITLEKQGAWLDQTSGTNAARLAATPLRRWWGEDRFRPIARIGEIGNDEYVLKSVDEADKDAYLDCNQIGKPTAAKHMACSPTLNEERIVAEIKARTTGELFLYVNDAVLMLPGVTDLFYRNHTGMGTIRVKRITGFPAYED
jgi:uncharacterized protein (DUF2235 family)